MYRLPYLLFISIFFLDYLSIDLGLIPRKLTWLPEIMSFIATAIIVIRIRYIKIKPKYIMLFVFFIIHVLAGAIVNKLQPGPAIAGIRTYFKFIPFFILPFALTRQKILLHRLAKFFLALSIMQFPIVFFQRFVQFKGLLTGDVVTGTLNSSGVLSIYLIGCISILYAFFLRQKISPKIFIILLLFLFLPTTVNETKVTLILLPIALFVPSFISYRHDAKKQKYLTVAFIAVLLFICFVPIYDYLVKPRHNIGIIKFFTSKEIAVPYLYKKSSEEYEREVEKRDNVFISPHQFRDTTKNIKRVDSIIIACRVLSRDPAMLFLGLGIGNASVSFVKVMSGEYSDYVELRSGMTAMTKLIWETGLIGVICVVTFLGFVFFDTMSVCHSEDWFGSFSLGWSSIPVILFVCLFYNNFIVHNIIGYGFYYFSGIIVSQKYGSNLGDQYG